MGDLVAHRKLVIAAGVVLVVVITALGVLQLRPEDTAEPVAAARIPPTALEVTGAFMAAFTSGRTTEAAALTDDAATAATQLAAVWQSLAPTSVTANRNTLVESAEQRFTLTWELGPGRTWSYESALRLVEDGEWRVHWEPALVHPKLTAGHNLALRDQAGQAAVLDRDGTPLLEWTATGATAVAPAAAPVLLPGMGRVVGTGAWYVALTDGAGKDVAVLHGTRTEALTSTVSRPVQQAAQAAVDAQDLATTVVAIQPSTGDLLAVAQNSTAGNGPVALQGLYPPGSTFKVATATALLEAGANVNTTVPCPGSTTVDRRTIRNADFELGDVPLRTAFAQSCNTSFAMAAADLPLDALPSAADQLGLGADFVIPGIDTEIGGVPQAADVVQQVENSIGQGQVQVSPFGLALMSATVADGSAVTPRLWPTLPTEVTTGYEAPRPGVTGALRTMMREVVTSGRATELADLGRVHGKTGTAETADSAHGWFTGFRDDLAFAVLVEDAGSSSTAVAVTRTFLTGLG
ncbi:penicillin-binding transpeptidase domain-containing protein [Actinophytocola glycyrrhizae]|uniref:Penicillin-binding transpeptidase domain-containing protein n=1 Tax=Actinophytocola glycyrrhizae TaxID=2044873 RepID=A0ABV9RV97_9PSEU